MKYNHTSLFEGQEKNKKKKQRILSEEPVSAGHHIREENTVENPASRGARGLCLACSSK